jgi:ABC-2 type transport system permease protein
VSATTVRLAALARRDLRVELSYHFQLYLRFFNIVFAVTMFYFLGELVGDAPQLGGLRGGYLEFVVIGLLLTGFAHACTSAFNQAITEAQADDTLEVLLATPSRFGTLLGGTLTVPLALSTIDTVLYLSLATLFVGRGTIDLSGLLIALPLLLLVLGTFAALGILSAAVIVLTKRGDPFSTLAIQVSNLLAGAMFPVVLLPDVLQTLARAIPAFYGLRSMRGALLGDAGLADVAGDALILVGFNLVLLPLSLTVFRRAVAIARVTGTLGNR